MDLIYRDVIEARRRGDRDDLSNRSIRLAHERLRRTGRDHVAVVRVPRMAGDRDRLDRVLRSMRLGTITLHLSWELPDAGERREDLVLLVPVGDFAVVEVLGRRAAVVGAAVGDAEELVEAIRRLRPGWRAVALDLRPSSFVEAVGEMAATRTPKAPR